MSKPLRAGGYCRTSGEGQRDNTSIPTQKEGIQARCKTEGWVLAETYVDEAKSGAKVEGRDAFKRMLTDCANGKLDVVVPFDATRFARDGVDVVSTAKVLKEQYGIFTVDSKGGFDNRDHKRALVNFVQAGVSEHERLTLKERTVSGRIKTAEAGLPWCRDCPVGRSFTRKGKREGTWEVNDQGRRLAALLERYAHGESLTALAKEFGYPEKAVLAHVRLGQLEATPYVVTFHSPDVGIVNRRVKVPAVPPVITHDLARRVRARAEHNKTWNRQALKKYLLSGFVTCAHCGKSLTCDTSKGLSFYRHHRRVGQGGKGCPFHSIRVTDLDGPVLDYLYDLFLDQPTFDLAVKLALPDPKDRQGKEEEMAQVKKELARAEGQIARLVDAVAAGVDPALLVGKQEGLKAERDALSRRLDVLKGEVEALPDPQAIIAEAKQIRNTAGWETLIGQTDWRSLPFDKVHRFLRWLFGDNPRKEGLGIFVSRDRGQWGVDIQARLRTDGWLIQGEPGIDPLVPVSAGRKINPTGQCRCGDLEGSTSWTCKVPAIPLAGKLEMAG